jgi:hypothetical protein
MMQVRGLYSLFILFFAFIAGVAEAGKVQQVAAPAPVSAEELTLAQDWDADRARWYAQDLSTAVSNAQYAAESEVYSTPGNDPDLWRKRQAVQSLRTLSWDARDLERAIRTRPESAEESRAEFNRVRSSFRWADTDIRWARFSSRVDNEFWRAQLAFQRLERFY